MPTFRRPGQLAKLLDAIAALTDAPARTVLIADNDADGCEGLAVVERMHAAGYPIGITAFCVAEKGLCNVRNALLAGALAIPEMTHVAMIDDDEWPEPGWLAALMAQQQATSADAVAGPVQARFDGVRPRWTTETFLFRPEARTAGIADMLWGTNNVLVTRGLLESTPRPWFDLAFNAIGGEDLDLFTRWRDAGRRFAWAPEAWVNEYVPADRARIGWVLRRLWRFGNTDTMVRWKHAGPAGRAVIVARAGAFLGVALAAAPLALLPGRRRIDHLGRPWRAVGRIAGLIGRPYREYG